MPTPERSPIGHPGATFFNAELTPDLCSIFSHLPVTETQMESPPSLCHPACPGVPWERSRGICSSAGLSWKCFFRGSGLGFEARRADRQTSAQPGQGWGIDSPTLSERRRRGTLSPQVSWTKRNWHFHESGFAVIDRSQGQLTFEPQRRSVFPMCQSWSRRTVCRR
jgi:hypothetical protein